MHILEFALVAAVVIVAQPVASAGQLSDRPVLVSSTYWGGTQSESFAAVAVDAAGNVYVAGMTASPDFPKTITSLPAPGSTDVFVTKFNAAGAVVFSTVFGGSSSEIVSAIAVRADGHVVVVGDTFSADLPVVNPVQAAFHPGVCGEFGGICSDGFAATLDPSGGSLVFATYLGTTRADNVRGVALDAGGNLYVVGATESSTFDGATPLRAFGGTRDAFVAKIPPAGGTFTYFTYLGGTFGESGNGIAVDAAGSAYVAGVTSSQNFPTLNPIQAGPENFSDSAFVTKLGPTGAIAYSTYLSGHASDAGIAIAVDASGSAHVAGVTASTNFPTVGAQQPFLRGVNDVFVAKLHPSGSSLQYSTYLGGNDREQVILDFLPALDVAVDAGGRVHVAGSTQSADFPAHYALQPFGGGVCLMIPFQAAPCPDAFVSMLDVDGQLLFSSPIGGGSDDRGRGIAVGPNGLIHVVGTTTSTNFPVRWPLQPGRSGASDAFVAQVAAVPPPCQLPAPAPTSPAGALFDEQPAFSWDPVPGAHLYAVGLISVAHTVLTGTPPVQLLGLTAATSLVAPVPLPAGDFTWIVVPWSATCGWGRSSQRLAFTLPGTCPAPAATLLSPVGGAVVPNPARLDWSTNGTALASLYVVVILRPTGQLVAQYATAAPTFTIPTTLSLGDYVWFVASWNSTCGAVFSAPAHFRSSGTVVP